MAATSGFQLGVDSTSAIPTPSGFYTTTDASGALYSLAACPSPPGADALACVTKVSPDGETVVWTDALGFWSSAMAVDPGGNVFVASMPTDGSPTSQSIVERVSADGRNVVWHTALGPGLSVLGLAVDAAGRVYATGGANRANYAGFLVRLSTTGTIDFTVGLAAAGYNISIDLLGYLSVQTNNGSVSSILRMGPDGTVSWSVNLASFTQMPSIAADASGNVWVYGDSGETIALWRFDASGNQTLAQTVGIDTFSDHPFPLALDSGGNAFIVRYTSVLIPTTNNLATCEGGTSYLSGYAADGSLRQTTYVPVAGAGNISNITVGSNSMVYLTGGSAASGSFLTRLSPSGNPKIIPLACLGSAATYDTGPIAPGEVVALFGSGLGPAAGMQTQATMESPFPTDAGSVQVTFDGIPAPLLWVQDRQVNAVVPWSLTPGQTTRVCALYQSSTTNCLTWPVVQTAPGVFTVGGDYAAAINEDGTINSPNHPAKAGSVIAVFATGMGPLSTPQADSSLVGLPLPVNQIPVAVTYNPGCIRPPECTFMNLTVDYEGPAPFQLAGMTQINFHAPDQTPSPLLFGAGRIWVGVSNQFFVYVAGP